MPKLIDSEKLLEYLQRHINKYLSGVGYEVIKDRIEDGTFDPTPPVQPTLQRGDKVRHKEFKNRGPGVVMLVMGEKSRVYFKDTKIGQPVKAYYRLDKLEVIK